MVIKNIDLLKISLKNKKKTIDAEKGKQFTRSFKVLRLYFQEGHCHFKAKRSLQSTKHKANKLYTQANVEII